MPEVGGVRAQTANSQPEQEPVSKQGWARAGTNKGLQTCGTENSVTAGTSQVGTHACGMCGIFIREKFQL